MSASKITQLMQSESFEEKFRKSWLEEKLDGLTLHVGIDRRYQRLGKEETDKVVKIVMENSPWEMNRVKFGGSVGTHTEVMTCEIDVVIFLNGDDIDFDSVLSSWRTKLLEATVISIVGSEIVQTSTHIQFVLEIEEGLVPVKMYPAYNMVKTMAKETRWRVKPSKVVTIQAENIKQLMTKSNRLKYKSSLFELTSGFFRNQEQFFTNKVVRLVKFWLKTLYLGKTPINGFRNILEIIAVSASRAVMNSHKRMKLKRSKLYDAFSKFLEEIQKIDKLRLAFKFSNGHWIQIEEEAEPSAETTGEFFILEPGNELNDLSILFLNHPEETENLKYAAQVTHSRLLHSPVRQAIWNPSTGTFDLPPGPDAPLSNIFRPVRKVWELFGRSNMPSDFVFEIDWTCTYKKRNCLMNVTRTIDGYNNITDIHEVIQTYLFTFGRAAESEVSGRNNRERFEKIMNDFITEDILGDSCDSRKQSKVSLKHEECDVMYYIPLEEFWGGVLKVGFQWK